MNVTGLGTIARSTLRKVRRRFFPALRQGTVSEAPAFALPSAGSGPTEAMPKSFSRSNSPGGSSRARRPSASDSGSTVALEDIQAGTGALEYYVGSHKLTPYLLS